MRSSSFSKVFLKKIKKLPNQELNIVLKACEKIQFTCDLSAYKNLRYDLKGFKRIHVSKSYVILFVDEDDNVHFEDYAHHDTIYKKKR